MHAAFRQLLLPLHLQKLPSSFSLTHQRRKMRWRILVLIALPFWRSATSPTVAKCITDCAAEDLSGLSNQQTVDTLTEEEIRRELLRIEGQRILEKLRLDRPPDIRVNIRDLPVPVATRVEDRQTAEESVANEQMDDALGKLKSVYVVGERPRRGRGRTHMCTDRHGRTAVCIEFELSGRSLANNRISHAILWLNLHLDEENTSIDDQIGSAVQFSPNLDPITFNLSIFALHRHGHEELIADFVESTATSEGNWLRVNVTEYIQGEMQGHTRTHRITLLISCSDEIDRGRPPPIAFTHTGRRRPFLELQTHRPEFSQADSRRKRSRLCGPGSTAESECCMETLYVNFTELGWHTWVLQPLGYYTGYCKGRCQSVATRNYNAIMKAVLQKRRDQQLHGLASESIPVDPEIAPCCSPLRMLPLEILWAKIENNHEQLSTAVLPAMIVDSCKC